MKVSRTSKNDKNRANQQEMLNDFNVRINKALKEHNSSSETTRTVSFNEWLGGLIDADGGFYVSKSGYLSCEITVALNEVESLHKIKSRFGGSVSVRSKVRAVRWRLHKKEGLIHLLDRLNGLLFIKQRQYTRAVALYYADYKTKGFVFRSESA